MRDRVYCVTLYLFFIEMMAGQISQIGWKSIEITLYACLLKALDAGRIRPVKFEIWPVQLGGNPLRL